MDSKKRCPRRKQGIHQLRRWEERLIKILMKIKGKNGKSVVKFDVKNSKIKEDGETVIDMYYKNRCSLYSWQNQWKMPAKWLFNFFVFAKEAHFFKVFFQDVCLHLVKMTSWFLSFQNHYFKNTLLRLFLNSVYKLPII